MYQAIHDALQNLSKGQVAELKRCSLKSLSDSPTYFRVLARAHVPDNKQSLRILFLLLHTKVELEHGQSIAQALLQTGVKESQIIQISRSGDNGIDYLKRQLVRCNKVDLKSLGSLAQYWGDQTRRQLLKEYIFAQTAELDSQSN